MLRALVLLALTADGGTMPIPTTPVRLSGYPLLSSWAGEE